MSNWFDKECPWNPMVARREGERARSWEKNPYEHGRDSWDMDCNRAYKEFERGRKQAEFDRREEARREEEAHAMAAQRRDFERQQYEAAQREEYERMEYEQQMASEQELAEAEAVNVNPDGRDAQ